MIFTDKIESETEKKKQTLIQIKIICLLLEKVITVKATK